MTYYDYILIIINKMEQHFGQIVLIDNFWGNKIIPAILRGYDEVLKGRYDVWIPDGYEGAGGFSTRDKASVYVFNGTDEVKNDVLNQWDIRQKEMRERYS
jgi:hypothetical protein